MNRSVLFVVLFLITSVFAGLFVFTEDVSASGPIYIGGVIDKSTTWSSANSPYIIQKNTTLMPGKTLTITAGTVVKFENNTRLNIRGFLDVKGNSTNRVLFTSNGTRYNYTHSSLINGIKVVYNGSGINYSIFIDCYNGGEHSISYAKFEYSSNYAINFRYFGPYIEKNYLITDTIFENNAFSINPGYVQSYYLLIERSTFSNNYMGIVSYYGGGGRILDSTFNNNTVGTSYPGWILNCSFNGNSVGVTPVSYYHTPAMVKFSKFKNNLIGLETTYSIKNTFENNTIGLIPFGIGQEKIINNNFINNTKYHLKMPDVDENEIYAYYWDTVVSGNWWGTTNTTIIDKYIYDVWDDPNLYEAKYKAILTSPAKAYNEPPVADAGVDQETFTNYLVSFDASNSYDPDEDDITYYWDFGDGSFWDWTTAIVVGHRYTTPGNYTVTLKVSDGVFETEDTCNATINKVNKPPLANAGPDQSVYVDQSVNFSGASSNDPDGDPLSYKWTFGDGSNSGWTNQNNTTHTYIYADTYYVSLEVSDGLLLHTDTCRIYVFKKPNSAPVANAGPDQDVFINQLVFFNANGTNDPDDDDLTYLWDFDDSDGNDQIDAEGIFASHTYKNVGNYTVTLRVTDGAETDTDSLVVKVTKSSINRAPIADAGSDRTVKINELFIVDGKNSYDPDEDPLQYKWDFGDSTKTNFSYDIQASHAYKSIGTFEVTLNITDGLLHDTDKITISVIAGNNAPIADAGPDQNATANIAVSFDGIDSYDPDTDDLTYKWAFADGFKTDWSNSSTASHSYNRSGTYMVTLTVSDGQEIDTDTCYVYVIQSFKPDMNNFPVFQSTPPEEAVVGEEWEYEPIATDPDNDDIVSLRLITGPDGMTFDNGLMKWIPTEEQIGTHFIVIEATDDTLKVFQRFNLTVIEADVDLSPPEVERTEPVPNSNNVSVEDSKVIINFTESMDRNSVEEALTVTPGAEYEIYWNDDDAALILIFTGELYYAITYTISIDSGAKDKNGNALEVPLGLVFTTESFTPVPDDTDDEGSNGSKNAGNNTGIYLLILSILIIVIITVFYLVVLKGKRMRRNEPDDGPGEYDARMMAGDERTASETGLEDDGEAEAIGLIVELRENALNKKKPSDFRINKNEILNRTKAKYDKGEISKETYESIEENLVRPEH